MTDGITAFFAGQPWPFTLMWGTFCVPRKGKCPMTIEHCSPNHSKLAGGRQHEGPMQLWGFGVKEVCLVR